MKQSLQQLQTQKLNITSELKQSLKILQLPNQELDLYLNELIISNPLLEFDENNFDDSISVEQLASDINKSNSGNNFEKFFEEKEKFVLEESF